MYTSNWDLKVKRLRCFEDWREKKHRGESVRIEWDEACCRLERLLGDERQHPRCRRYRRLWWGGTSPPMECRRLDCYPVPKKMRTPYLELEEAKVEGAVQKPSPAKTYTSQSSLKVEGTRLGSSTCSLLFIFKTVNSTKIGLQNRIKRTELHWIELNII